MAKKGKEEEEDEKKECDYFLRCFFFRDLRDHETRPREVFGKCVNHPV